MGPQLDSCGRLPDVAVLGGVVVASMGPQLDSCGRLPRHAAARRAPVGFNGAAT